MRFYVRSPFFSRVAIVVLLDLAALIASFSFAFYTLPEPVPFSARVALTLGVALVALLSLQATGAYGLATLPNGSRTTIALLSAMGIGFGGAIFAYLLLPVDPVVTHASLRAAALFIPLFLVERKGFRSVSKRVRKRILLVGTGELATDLMNRVKEREGLGLEVVGVLTGDDDEPWEVPKPGIPILGLFHHVEKLMRGTRAERIADWVVVTSRGRNEPLPAGQLLQLKTCGIPVCSGTALYERITGEVYVNDLRSSVLIFGSDFGMNLFERALKRSLDVAVSAVALVLLTPVLLAAALAIRLDSKGSIFFKQVRVGRLGECFEIIKLRTMKEAAEDGTGPTFASRDDDRITRVGRLLRRTRIDELPQLWNVLKGEMSIVGPRPERPEFLDEINRRYPYFPVRAACRPGVTGWAQVRLGYVSDIEGIERKLALDLFYLRNASITLDLWIIWSTLRTVFTLSGV